MKTTMALAVALAAVTALGCAGQGGRAGREGAPFEETGATAAMNEFLKLVASGDYAAVSAMVIPAQARGFDPKAFVADRFRMKLGDFQVYSWDSTRFSVTRDRKTGATLVAAAVGVRIMSTNEGRPVIVNTFWRESGGKWYLVPYPEAS